MTHQPHSFQTIISHWRTLACLLVACARLVCRRSHAGADGVLEQVDQLQAAVRSVQVMVCQQITDIPDTDEASRKAREQLCAIAAALFCLTVFLITVRLSLRGGSTGRAERRGIRLIARANGGGDRFGRSAARLCLQQLCAPP